VLYLIYFPEAVPRCSVQGPSGSRHHHLPLSLPPHHIERLRRLLGPVPLLSISPRARLRRVRLVVGDRPEAGQRLLLCGHVPLRLHTDGTFSSYLTSNCEHYRWWTLLRSHEIFRCKDPLHGRERDNNA